MERGRERESEKKAGRERMSRRPRKQRKVG